jgi:phosphoglycolate phosphatase
MKLILWDIDHTLVRVNRLVGEHMFNEMFRTFFEVDSAEVVSRLHFAGRTDKSLVLEIAQRLGIPRDTVANNWQQVCGVLTEMAFELIGPATVSAMPGAEQCIESATAMGFHHAIVSGNIRTIGLHKLYSAMPGVPLHIGAFGNEFADRAMLPPLAIERYNQHHGTSFTAQSSVVVGDAPPDIVCAHVNNIPCVALALGSYNAAQLAEAGANCVREGFRPVYDLLDVLHNVRFGSTLL